MAKKITVPAREITVGKLRLEVCAIQGMIFLEFKTARGVEKIELTPEEAADFISMIGDREISKAVLDTLVMFTDKAKRCPK